MKKISVRKEPSKKFLGKILLHNKKTCFDFWETRWGNFLFISYIIVGVEGNLYHVCGNFFVLNFIFLIFIVFIYIIWITELVFLVSLFCEVLTLKPLGKAGQVVGFLFLF